jgi:hypothetical protein
MPAMSDGPASAARLDLRRYRTGQSLMAQARALARSDAHTLAALATAGVPAVLARDLGRSLDIPPRHFFRDILGTNRSAAEKKSFTDAPLPAAAGQVALAILRLLGHADAVAGGSPPAGAGGFDAARWLGRWLEQPQDALQGRAPTALLADRGGLEQVMQALEAAGAHSSSRPATSGARRPAQ